MSDEQTFNFFIHHLLQRFFPHTASDIPLIPSLIPNMNAELIDILVKTTWVKTNVHIVLWSQFVKQYSGRMYSSNLLYVTYMFYACQVVNDGIIDFHDRFLSVISTAMSIAKIFAFNGRTKFLQYTSKILCVCYKNMLKRRFRQSGSWNRLGIYVSRSNYLETYEEMSSHSKIGSFTYVKYAEEMDSHTWRIPKCTDDIIISREDVESNLKCMQLAEEVLSDFQQEASNFGTSSRSSSEKYLTENSKIVASNTVFYSEDLKETQTSCLKETDFEDQRSSQNVKVARRRSASVTTKIFRNTEMYRSRRTKKVRQEKVKKDSGTATGKSLNSDATLNYPKSKKDVIHSEFSNSSSKSVFLGKRKDNNVKENAIKRKEPDISKFRYNMENSQTSPHDKFLMQSNRADELPMTTSQIECETSCSTTECSSFIQVSQSCSNVQSLPESKRTSSTNNTETNFAIPNNAEPNSSVLDSASKQIFEEEMENTILLKAKRVLRDLICEAEALGDMLNFFV